MSKYVNVEYQRIIFIDDWSTHEIAARIISMYPLKTFRTGSILSLIIADLECSDAVIKLIICNDLAITVNAKFKPGSLITIQNYRVEDRNHIFNETTHKYELHSTSATVIETLL